MTDYNSINALNWSTLKYLATSPLLYKWRLDNPEPKKDAFVVGAAAHCALLEPGEFDSRYAVYVGRRFGKKWDSWQEDHPSVATLKSHEMRVVEHITNAVLDNRDARELLEKCRHEEPMQWVDPDTGLQCKGRVDALCPDFVCDLKTTRNVDPWVFARDFSRYMYDGQLAFYHTGAETLRKISGRETPWVIAAQNCEPYDVVVYRMKPADLDTGRQLCLRLMKKLEECKAADWWPGCAPGIQYLDVPPRYGEQQPREEMF